MKAKKNTASTATKKAKTVESSAPPAGPGTIRRDIGRLEYLDPHRLVVDPFNHRKKRANGDSTEPDAATVTSVQAEGVQVPLLVRPQADGSTMGVVWGQRRLKAALIAAAADQKAGRPYALVPCLVREDLAGADDQALVLSMLENTQRKAASTRDDLDALEQLALMPISATRRTRHARTLGYTKAEVTAANKAAQLNDEQLASALGAAGFDLVQAADYAEVEDVPGALRRLERAATEDRRAGTGQRGRWSHAMQQLRQEHADKAKRERAEAELTAQGVRLLRHAYSWDTTVRPLSDLRTTLDKPLTAENHAASCAAHAAALDPDTAEPVYLCTDWKQAGHRLSAEAARTSGQPTDREAAAAQRREVIASNKAWRAAREVRAEFITALCARKTASDEVWRYALDVITGCGYDYAKYTRSPKTSLMARFLGVPDPENSGSRTGPWAEVIARTGRNRRWRPLLAQVAAAMETHVMHDRAWRTPGAADIRQWLQFLQPEGYVLSDIEARTAGRKARSS
jgi:ParB family chromosome partitioning protein